MKLALLLLPFLFMPFALHAQPHCQLIPVDGGTVRTCISGDGPATIVLAAGAGQMSGTWTPLAPELAKCARVVTFDRPGFGGSPAVTSPRTPTRIATELRTVLDSLAVNDPILLVGHSMGGVHVLRYATLFPKDVAGVVLLDTPPPGFEQERLTLLTTEEIAQREQMLEDGLAGVPESVRLERAGARHAREWEFPDFPRDAYLLVVVADSQYFGELGNETDHRNLWLSRSRLWLELSDDSELVVANGSGHMVHHDRPGLVADEIRTIMRREIGNDVSHQAPEEICR